MRGQVILWTLVILAGCSQPFTLEGVQESVEVSLPIDDKYEAIEYSKSLINISQLHDALQQAGSDAGNSQIRVDVSLRDAGETGEYWYISYTTNTLPAYSCSIAFKPSGEAVHTENTGCGWNK